MAAWLLTHLVGADANQRFEDCKGSADHLGNNVVPPLWLSAQLGHAAAARMLIEQGGAEVDAVDRARGGCTGDTCSFSRNDQFK